MVRFLLFVLMFSVAVLAGGFDLDKDMALAKANQGFREAAAEAIQNGHAEQLVQIERDAAAFADSVGYSKALLQDNEVIFVRFLEKDYAFLADVDSIREYDFTPNTSDRFGDVLKAHFRKMKESGELEKDFMQIPNASDRAFARIMIARCMNESLQSLSEMIEKYTDDMSNEAQLRYLVQKYWNKEGFDMETYTCVAVGVPYNMMLGDVSKTLDDGFGFSFDFDYTYNNIFLGMRVAIELNEYTGESGANYTGGGFFFDVGRTLFHTERFFFRPYVGVGLGINELRWDKEDFVDEVYPSFEAGGIADVFFNTTSSMRVGLRLRSGIRTISAGPEDISSGTNFSTSLSFVLLETKYKKYDFKYPEKKQ